MPISNITGRSGQKPANVLFVEMILKMIVICYVRNAEKQAQSGCGAHDASTDKSIPVIQAGISVKNDV